MLLVQRTRAAKSGARRPRKGHGLVLIRLEAGGRKQCVEHGARAGHEVRLLALVLVSRAAVSLLNINEWHRH